jgi:hypothetical protein
MPDPRKQTQFVEQLYRYRLGRIDFTSAQLSSIKRDREAQQDGKNDDEYVLKKSINMRKHGI